MPEERVFLRIYEDRRGLIQVELNLPEALTGQFGGRGHAERIYAAMLKAHEFTKAAVEGLGKAVGQ